MTAAVTAVLGVALVGCGEADEPTEPPVTVPLTRADSDPTYEAANEATISNEEWPDGTFGQLTVRARDVGWQDNRTPYLTATVTSSTAEEVSCTMARVWVWSSQTEFMALNMKCDQRLDLASVESVEITSD